MSANAVPLLQLDICTEIISIMLTNLNQSSLTLRWHSSWARNLKEKTHFHFSASILLSSKWQTWQFWGINLSCTWVNSNKVRTRISWTCFNFVLADGTMVSDVPVKGDEIQHCSPICSSRNRSSKSLLFKEDNFWYMCGVDEEGTAIFPYLHFIPLLISLAW